MGHTSLLYTDLTVLATWEEDNHPRGLMRKTDWGFAIVDSNLIIIRDVTTEEAIALSLQHKDSRTVRHPDPNVLR